MREGQQPLASRDRRRYKPSICASPGTFFGLGPQNYRYGNPTGPDPHVVSRGGTERNGYDQFHYDGRYPYATVPGFFDHAGSVSRTIEHYFTGPHELPY